MVPRTVLPRKGLVQPLTGSTGWNTDVDNNWAALDANVAYMSDLQQQDLGLDGVLSGFTLSTSSSLTPGLTAGLLYAQGIRYNPASSPAIPPALASTTSYLFFTNSTSPGSFYWAATPAATHAGDAMIGSATCSSSAVTAVAQATKLFGQISAAPSAPGNFQIAHLLGRTPVGVVILMTSGGAIWFQSPTLWDGTNVYLVASDTGVTAQVEVF